MTRGWLVAQVLNMRAAHIAVTGEIERRVDGEVAKFRVSEPIGEWRVPSEEVTVVQKRVANGWYGAIARGPRMRVQRRKVSLPLFPGYAFIRPLPGKDWPEIVQAHGVDRLLGQHEPAILSDDQLDRVIERAMRIKVGEVKDAIRMRVGMLVRVADGPFASFNGVIETVTAGRTKEHEDGRVEVVRAERVKVAVNMFGRQTPVELEDWQVVPVDD